MMIRILLLILLLPSIAFAGPFIECDYQGNIDTYLVSVSGTVYERDWQPSSEPDRIRINLDLSQFPNGMHQVEVRAKNMWGVSDPAPFEFTKAAPSAPKNVSIK